MDANQQEQVAQFCGVTGANASAAQTWHSLALFGIPRHIGAPEHGILWHIGAPRHGTLWHIGGFAFGRRLTIPSRRVYHRLWVVRGGPQTSQIARSTKSADAIDVPALRSG